MSSNDLDIDPSTAAPRPWLGKGDPNPDVIFHAVGYALTCWETMEYHLADLFDVLVSGPKPKSNRAGFSAYVSVVQSSAHCPMLKAASAKALIDAASQQHINNLIYLVGEFAARRNEIAHGRVYNLGAFGFCLGPNNTMPRKFTKDGTAKYQYTSMDIAFYAERFSKLSAISLDISNRITPEGSF